MRKLNYITSTLLLAFGFWAQGALCGCEHGSPAAEVDQPSCHQHVEAQTASPIDADYVVTHDCGCRHLSEDVQAVPSDQGNLRIEVQSWTSASTFLPALDLKPNQPSYLKIETLGKAPPYWLTPALSKISIFRI